MQNKLMKYLKVSFSVECPDELRQDCCDVLAAMAGDCGFETFEETAEGLAGYVIEQQFDDDSLKQTIGDFPFDEAKITYTVEEAEYKDWNEQWENEGFAPIYINNVCAIHDGRHLPEFKTQNPKLKTISVEIDAKLAFGTGNHSTTRLMAQRILGLDMAGKRVLDCGCGTGILGILALKCGAREVVGYDIDEWSADNARHNAVINMVGESYESLLGDVSVVRDQEPFDVVMANINRNILLQDMPDFIRLLANGGTLLLSGFYEEDADCLTEQANKAANPDKKMTLEGKSVEDGWTCLQMKLADL